MNPIENVDKEKLPYYIIGAGFSSTSQTPITTKILEDVTKELQIEREEAAKLRAKELVGKDIELSQKRDAARKAFSAQDKKFDKELGKLINQIESSVNGRQNESEDSEDSESSDQ